MDSQNGYADPSEGWSRDGVADLIGDHRFGHWTTQLDSFITVRSGGTDYGMYQQALRQAERYTRGLNSEIAARDRLLVDIEELEWRIEHKAGNYFDQKRDAISLKEKQEALVTVLAHLADTERQRDHFLAQCETLRQRIGITAEKPLTSEWRTQLDREKWEFLLTRDAAMELMCGGAVRQNTLALIMSLPPTCRDPIIALIRGQVEYLRRVATGETLPGDGPLTDWFFASAPNEPCLESSASLRLLQNSSATDAAPSLPVSTPAA